MIIGLVLILIGLFLGSVLASSGNLGIGKIVYYLTLAGCLVMSLYLFYSFAMEKMMPEKYPQGISPWLDPVFGVILLGLIIAAWLDFNRKYSPQPAAH